jgi:transglutaminase-like putative cysteine protease
MKNKKIILIITAVLSFSIFSGCIEFFQDITTTYKPFPTKLSYEIDYGYRIQITGTGKYEVRYRCDIPEILMGVLSYDLLYKSDYTTNTIVNNSYINWTISGREDTTYELGLNARVTSESFLITDLNGKNALTIEEIKHYYPKIVKQYCNAQVIEHTTFIDPNNPNIKSISNNVLYQVDTNNSFIGAKSLFIWLKENTNYQLHDGQGEVQPAAVTLQKRTGDCDDLSFLYISLCRAVNIPARFIRGYLLQENKNSEVTATAHAWVEVFVGGIIGNGGWIPVECACCASSIEIDINQNFGIEDAFHLRLFTDDGSNESLDISLSGIHVQYYENQEIDLQSFSEVKNYIELASKKLVVTNDNIRYYQ